MGSCILYVICCIYYCALAYVGSTYRKDIAALPRTAARARAHGKTRVSNGSNMLCKRDIIFLYSARARVKRAHMATAKSSLYNAQQQSKRQKQKAWRARRARRAASSSRAANILSSSSHQRNAPRSAPAHALFLFSHHFTPRLPFATFSLALFRSYRCHTHRFGYIFVLVWFGLRGLVLCVTFGLVFGWLVRFVGLVLVRFVCFCFTYILCSSLPYLYISISFPGIHIFKTLPRLKQKQKK